MRVIHVLDHSAPLRTAYASRTLAMLAELRSLGWETFQITGPKQGPAAAAEEQVDGWTFHRTPPPGGILEGVPVLGELELMGEITYRIEKVARRVRPHLVHAHSPVLNALPALRVARRLRIPAIYEVRSLWEDAAVEQGTASRLGLRYRASRALESWALRQADAVVTVSEGLRSELAARNVSARKLSVIPHAVDTATFAPVPRDTALAGKLGLAGRFVVGALGPFYTYEGADLLVEALHSLLPRHPDASVLLVGSGPEEPALRGLAQRLGLAERVVFAGEVSAEALAAHCGLMDIVVSPRRSTRLTEIVPPLKVLEALARGCTVLASDVGGHRELIRSGETGLLFETGNAAVLASVIERLKSQPEYRAAIGHAARSYTETERSWKANAGAYDQLYTQLARPEQVH